MNMRILLLAAALTVLASSCTYDNLETQYGLADCEATEVSFHDDIKEIIATNCALSFCHVQGTGLPDFSNYENIAEKASLIKFQTISGTMPPPLSDQSLTAAEVQKIACWVDAGAPNN